MAELLAPHPGVTAWLQRMRDACAPHYDGASACVGMGFRGCIA